MMNVTQLTASLFNQCNQDEFGGGGHWIPAWDVSLRRTWPEINTLCVHFLQSLLPVAVLIPAAACG